MNPDKLMNPNSYYSFKTKNLIKTKYWQKAKIKSMLIVNT